MGVKRSTRPGGRSARVRAAVFEAVLAEMVESGYAGVTMEGIARRSGVNRTTLYRRWGDRAALAGQAAEHFLGEYVPIPDTGTLRGDLLAFANLVLTTISSPTGRALVRVLVAEGDPSDEERAARQSLWDNRLLLVRSIFDRAVERGELPSGVDHELVIDLVLAPLYLRVLVMQRHIDHFYIDAVVDLVLTGIGANSGGRENSEGKERHY